MSMQETNSLTLDNLFGATQIMPVVADKLSIPSGKLTRGSIVTSAGALCGTSGTPYAVLAEDVDASAGAVEAPVYLTGEFNASALTVASGATVAGLKTACRNIGIFIK